MMELNVPIKRIDWSMNFVESEKTIVRACYTGTGQQNDVPGDGFKSGSEMLAGFDQQIALGCRFDTRMPEYPEIVCFHSFRAN